MFQSHSLIVGAGNGTKQPRPYREVSIEVFHLNLWQECGLQDETQEGEAGNYCNVRMWTRLDGRKSTVCPLPVVCVCVFSFNHSAIVSVRAECDDVVVMLELIWSH